MYKRHKMNDFDKLTKRFEKTGCRHPKNPNIMLKPSHPYCKAKINARKLESKIDFSKDPIKSEKYFQKLIILEKKEKIEKDKL